MITAAMLAEAFTETTEPEHRQEVPPFSEAPDEVVQHFQRAADWLNTRAKPPQPADDNHKALVEDAFRAGFAAGLNGNPILTDDDDGDGGQSEAALAAFQSRQEESR